MQVKDRDKPVMLEQELEEVDEKRAIVFVNTKKKCDVVCKHLEGLDHRCTILHGGKTQARAFLRAVIRAKGGIIQSEMRSHEGSLLKVVATG